MKRVTEDQYALKGFMNNAYHAVSRNQRKQLVIEQLRRFYGDKVDSYRSYRELVWQKSRFPIAITNSLLYHINTTATQYFKNLFLISGY